MATIGVWTNLEGHVGLWVACFPAMQPIVRILSYKLGIRSKLNSNGATPAKNTYGVNGSNHKGVQRSTHGYLRKGEGVDRTDTDADSQKAINPPTDNFELNQIRKQTDLDIKIEERYPSSEKNHNKSRQESWADL